jgi:NADP-dependent 3-hydroxy acid dehydrogenase YdfG
MKNSLKGKVVLITGGAKGIGFEDAKLFLKQGAKVAICDFSKKDLKNSKRTLKQYGELFAKVADVRYEKQVVKFTKEIISQFGRIDILVNNAGILPPRKDFSQQKSSVIDTVIDTNLKGILYMTRAVVKHMISRKSGVIINMSSLAGIEGYAGMAVYSATKFGIRGFSEALREELSGRKIQVYSICPGAVRTDLNAKFTGEPAVGIPPEEVAKLIVKIASTLPQSRSCFEI